LFPVATVKEIKKLIESVDHSYCCGMVVPPPLEVSVLVSFNLVCAPDYFFYLIQRHASLQIFASTLEYQTPLGLLREPLPGLLA
jgi:hypothetical protein